MLQARIGNHTYADTNAEDYFRRYRENTIGYHQDFESPYGRQKLVYADWAASGRLYGPIEEKMTRDFGPFVGNTHSHSSHTGKTMTAAYEMAKHIFKQHVNAGKHDMIIFAGAGMTAAVNKLQRLLGLKVPEKLKSRVRIAEEERPVIFVTHMEHHSNHISWSETIGDVVCVPPGEDGSVDPDKLERLLQMFRHRKIKIGTFTACSNVTGFETPVYRLARKMHEHGGVCFVDYAASAPYREINMHPGPPLDRLDGILLSPHKFLGGPGTSGILVMDSRLCTNQVPDHPGGGTVSWTNAWGEYNYWDNIEAREDGGTPGFMQAIRTALCIKLKEHMGTDMIREREKELTDLLLNQLEAIPGLHILGGRNHERLGIISFVIEGIHYNLIVKLLNDRFGVQARGGCSCAGTYGHYLLNINRNNSKRMTDLIDAGDHSERLGWVRLSLHPMMTNGEISYIGSSVREIASRIEEWKQDYVYEPHTNEWRNIRGETQIHLPELFELRE